MFFLSVFSASFILCKKNALALSPLFIFRPYFINPHKIQCSHPLRLFTKSITTLRYLSCSVILFHSQNNLSSPCILYYIIFSCQRTKWHNPNLLFSDRFY